MPHPIYFASVGPDHYHWMHTVTVHTRRKDAVAAVNLRAEGWVGAVTSQHQSGKWEPSTTVVDYATDETTKAMAQRFADTINQQSGAKVPQEA